MGGAPRHHSAEKQAAIRTQVNKLLELGVIEESQASEKSQARPVPKGDGQWRLTLDFETYITAKKLVRLGLKTAAVLRLL